MVKYYCKLKRKEDLLMSSAIGNIQNVKIFVLYLMENINYPLDLVTVNDIVMQTDYVMYLDFAVAFNEMLDGGLIEKTLEGDEEKYFVTEKGRYVARELKSDLLSSILDQSLANALRYLDFKKRGIVPTCTVEQTEDGRYNVVCSFTENKVCIFSQTLTVDTLDRATRMKNNFYERPEAVYRGVVALLAGDVNYLFN